MERTRWAAAVASAIALVAAAATWMRDRAGLERARRATAIGARRLLAGWRKRPGARERELRQLARIPLPNLYEVHPEARAATPREIGFRSVELADIAGTGVAGATQRGSDFKPLPPFRSANWEARWQRISRAVDRLAILPPIDVVRYPPGARYWVTDGHNRVAAALEADQVSIDANVTELVPIGQNPSERPDYVGVTIADGLTVRAAGRGERLETLSDDEIVALVGRDDSDSDQEDASRPAPDDRPSEHARDS